MHGQGCHERVCLVDDGELVRVQVWKIGLEKTGHLGWGRGVRYEDGAFVVDVAHKQRDLDKTPGLERVVQVLRHHAAGSFGHGEPRPQGKRVGAVAREGDVDIALLDGGEVGGAEAGNISAACIIEEAVEEEFHLGHGALRGPERILRDSADEKILVRA